MSRAAANQRRGRAGRTEPGVCYRLWDEPQTASLEPYSRPEILAADLSGLLLDLAQWGATDPATLAFLDPPPSAALAEAKALLAELGAIDAARPHHRRRPPAARAAAAAAARPHGGRSRRRGCGTDRGGDRRNPVRTRPRRRRCRSAFIASINSAATARAARRTCGGWRNDGPTRRRAAMLVPACPSAPSWRWPIPTASPRAAARAARSCWPMAAAPTSIWRRRWHANRSWWLPSLPDAPRKAASCSPRRYRLRRSKRAFPIGSSTARR